MDYVKLRLYGQTIFESTFVFCSLENKTKNSLCNFPQVYQRSVAALQFRRQISNSNGASDEIGEIMKVAYLRASLMEFVGMEEMLKADLQIMGLRQEPLKMNATENAMLILLRELRNLQLHIKTITLSNDDRPAIYLGQERNISIEIIPLTDLQGIKDVRNARYYDPGELDDAINWLNDAQMNWGIGDIIHRGVQVYADLIIDKYNLNTQGI
jgi:hypothetical protein